MVASSSAQRRHSNRPSSSIHKMRRVSALGLFLGAFVFGYSLMTQLFMFRHAADENDDPLRVLSGVDSHQHIQGGAAAASAAAEPPHRRTENNDTTKNSTTTPFSVCGYLQTSASPLQLWVDHLPQILAASQLVAHDPRYELEPLTATVLNRITRRLEQSVKALPRIEMDSSSDSENRMGRLVAKFERRWAYLRRQQQQQQQPNTGDGDDDAPIPPPVTITVLGGSVTAGVNCVTGISRLHLERCAWPSRLQQFLDNLMGLADVVRVRTLAAGGTNSATGQAVLEYDLVPDLENGSATTDILINAYATNDMHVLTMQEAADEGRSVRDKVFAMAQDFVRTALQNQNCISPQQQDYSTAAPILYWLDDYLGNEQRSILQTQELAQSVHVLANYYGFGFVSYADAVRDWVYGDTAESMFSPKGWWELRGQKGNTTTMQREIHPGQAMHMSVAWMMAYNLLRAASQYCTLERATEQSSSILETARQRRLDDISESVRRETPQPPRSRPAGLPPPLLANLTLDVVTQEWRAANNSKCTTAAATGGKRCPLSWVSAMPWREKRQIQKLFHPVVVVEPQPGWHIHDDTRRQNKFGWSPVNGVIGEAVTFQFNREDYAADRLQSVTLFFLKSYGEKWENSTATVSVERRVVQVGTSEEEGEWISALEVPHELTGTHDKQTSETYTETVPFLPPPAVDNGGDERTKSTITDVRVTLTLTGGKTFKLTGIAVCQ